MKNFVQEGKTMTITAGATIASGAGVLVGSVFGVAVSSAVSGDKLPLALEGVYNLPKATGAISQGAKVYWDDTNKNVTTTASGNTLIGYAWDAQLSGDTTVNVLLAR